MDTRKICRQKKQPRQPSKNDILSGILLFDEANIKTLFTERTVSMIVQNLSGLRVKKIPNLLLSLRIFLTVVCFAGISLSNIIGASAEIIFQDNFDDHSDWSPPQSLTTDYGVANGALDGSTACTAENGHPGCPDGSAKYSAYFLARSAWADYNGHNTLNISSDNARGGTGKALTLWMEPIDSIRCDGGTKWCSDGQLSVNLPQTYHEIYIRYYLMFQPGWKWADSGGAGKFLRASHYHNYPDVPYYKFFKDGNHFPIFVLDLTDQAYFTADGSDPFAEVHMHPRFQSAYYGSAAVPQPAYLVNWDFERIRVGTGGTGWNGYITFEQFIADGKWHRVEVHLKGNSAMGAEDGIYELWVDRDVIVSRNNIAWADSVYEEACANCINPPRNFVGWNWVSIGGNQFNIAYSADTHMEQWYAIDDIVISTEPTAIDDNGGIPASPANLRIAE